MEVTSVAQDPSRSIAKRQADFPSRIAAVLSYAILLGGIITMVVTAYLVIVSYSSLPYADGWDEIGAAAYGSSQLNPAWLWLQHSEHRLVIPKIFLAVDLTLFQASQKFLLASIFAIQFLHVMLLGWSMRVLGGWRGTVWRTGVGLATFCLFCPAQWENFVWGFQVCFVLPGLFGTLSFVGLLLYWMDSTQPDRPRAWIWLLVADLSALGATYSLANGNLLWPILIAAAILLRLRLPATLTLVSTGAVSSALYFHRYARPPWHADPISSLGDPVSLLKYLTSYFGSSFVRGSLHIAVMLGLAGLTIAAAAILGFTVYVRSRRIFAIQLVLTLVFCAGTAFITALGRLNFGVAQAFTSRYQTIALLFWCCLGLMALWYASTPPHSRILLVILQTCLLVIMVGSAFRAPSTIVSARLHGFRLDRTGMLLLTGVSDVDNFRLALGQSPEQLVLEIRYLRSHRVSAFSNNAYLQLDTPLKVTFQVVTPEDCRGALESTMPLENRGGAALGITGWAWDNKHQRPPAGVVVTVNGVITGLAAVGEQRPATRTADWHVKSDWVGFSGYVRDVRPATAISVYAVLSENPPEACPIATVNYSEVK